METVISHSYLMTKENFTKYIVYCQHKLCTFSSVVFTSVATPLGYTYLSRCIVGNLCHYQPLSVISRYLLTNVSTSLVTFQQAQVNWKAKWSKGLWSYMVIYFKLQQYTYRRKTRGGISALGRFCWLIVNISTPLRSPWFRSYRSSSTFIL